MKIKHFTLIELILLVAAVAVLMLLLLRGMAKLSACAADTACRNNQQQIFAALTAYSQSYENHAPYVDYELGAGGGSSTRITWGSALNHGEFIKDNAVYFCPAAASSFTGAIGLSRSRADGAENCIVKPASNLERYRFINYGINYEYIAGNYGSWHSKDQRELVTAKLTDIKNPAGKIMLADAWNGNRENGYGRHLISGNIESNRSNRINPCHEESAIVLWSDGHITPVADPVGTIQKGDIATIRRYFNVTREE
jgi:competence protein ComGC